MGVILGRRPSGGGSGSQAGSPTVRGPFSLAFDDAGLSTGIEFYVPTVGDILLDAWVEFDVAWNGTTPLLDIGTAVGTSNGMFFLAGDGAPVDATNADNDGGLGTGVLWGTGVSSLVGREALTAQTVGYRLVPAKFTAANPLKVWVTQDGAAGGADPGATTGAAKVYIVTATPVAFV